MKIVCTHTQMTVDGCRTCFEAGFAFKCRLYAIARYCQLDIRNNKHVLFSAQRSIVVYVCGISHFTLRFLLTLVRLSPHPKNIVIWINCSKHENGAFKNQASKFFVLCYAIWVALAKWVNMYVCVCVFLWKLMSEICVLTISTTEALYSNVQRECQGRI